MNRFSRIGRCRMNELLIDFPSNDLECDNICELFPHRYESFCELDDIYDLDQLTAEFVFEKAFKHELSCRTTVTAGPTISEDP